MPGSADSVVAEMLNTVQARVDLVRHLEETFDQELLELAKEQVSQRVEPHTWEAFRLTALEGLPGAAAAEQLGLTAYVVFKAKSKVQRMLKEEVARLEAAGPEEESR